ncbi:MAG: hypothetical protein AAGU27_17890 [Dehalobacterium sp.]
MDQKKNCLGDTIIDLIFVLKPLSESYRLLVGAADEFNKIALAHKKDLEDAIDRADDLGDIIDKVIKTLDTMMEKELHHIKYREEDQETLIEEDLLK